MLGGVPNIDSFIEMDRRAFAVYLVTGLLILVVAGGVLAMTFTASVAGTPDLIFKSAGFVVAILSGLPFEKCLARHERVNTLLTLKKRCEELAADPSSAGPDAVWIKSLIERLFEKRLLG